MCCLGWETKIFLHLRTAGEMAEWSNAAVLKTVVPQGTGGSNPSLSAKEKSPKDIGLFSLIEDKQK